MFIAPVLVNYGQGTSPVLPVNIQCTRTQNVFSNCSMAEKNNSQCRQVAGVDCIGIWKLSNMCGGVI